MYAIVDFMGYQYRIEKDATLKVPYIAKGEAGNEIKIEKILMIHDNESISFGHPVIDAAQATAEIIKHGRDRKVIVFKKKRRKGYRKTQGHRQYFTEIKIKDIKF
ncbi:MAG: 50S ribosomal protein L21 [Candidatus Cloacimonetes bacterium]|jgi:large subunit ribosomal protein L21|nr:50S ribosomal protein L21 [Candidatus Cloacimonadota bacterium]MDD4156025.1 50S ribosomal protein L21 [Candidatus Cloacimonadota bacterium]